jgi:hypothetical protein
MKSLRRSQERLRARAKRRAMYEAGKARGERRSRYGHKVVRKCGRGTVDPRWMWWMSRGDA